MKTQNMGLRGSILKRGYHTQAANSHLLPKASLRLETIRRGQFNKTDWFYVPFSGYASLPHVARYPFERVLGVDTDKDALESCQAKYPQSTWIEGSATTFSGFDDRVFCFADFDPFNNPYKAIVQFRNHATLADRIGIVVTDSIGKKMMRGGFMFDFWEGRYTEHRPASARQFLANYEKNLSEFLSVCFNRKIAWARFHKRPTMLRYSAFILEPNST